MPLPRSLPDELAGEPFSVRQAAAAGLSQRRLRGRDLHAPFHGTRVDSPPRKIAHLCRAYATRMPDDAFFSGPTAALLLGVPLPWRLQERRILDVSVPAPRRAPSGAGVRGRAVSVTPQDVRVHEGLSVSSPGRLWCELGTELDLLDLVAAGDFLIHHRRGLATRRHLEQALEAYPGRRGRPRLFEGIPLLDDRSDSRRESHLRVILLRGLVPGLVTNLPITTSGGVNYRADLTVPSRKAVIEYQSDYHGDMVQFRKDMTRRGRLEADGWLVILVNIDDLRDPSELLARISRQLGQRRHYSS